MSRVPNLPGGPIAHLAQLGRRVARTARAPASALVLPLVLALAPAPPVRAASTATMLEGAPTLIRAAAVHALIPGTVLDKGDVVASGDGGFVQMEFDGGSVVALGPLTGVLIAELPRARGRAGSAPQLVLLHGWAKLEARDAGAGIEVWSRAHAVDMRSGSAVMQAADTATTRLFVETGVVSIAPVGTERNRTASNRMAAARTPVAAGQYVVARERSIALEAQAGAAPDFVAAMPRMFRDTLPPMNEHVEARASAGPLQREVSYEDVAELLALPLRWRTGFVRRFEGRLRDPAFRHAVDASMNEHPEWDRVLHPEKYREDPP